MAIPFLGCFINSSDCHFRKRIQNGPETDLERTLNGGETER